MGHLLLTLAHNEMRLRMRRLGTLVAMLAMIALGWAMIGDPASGSTMMSVKDARVLYNSSALALGSAALMGPLLTLVGFYLLRGRMGEDLRSGMGSVIATTSVPTSVFLIGRWLGSAAYLTALSLVFMLAIGVFHALRGEGPYLLLTYLQTYALILLPTVLFTASAALLFDAVPWLMGKLGDTLYFFFWIFELTLVSRLTGGAGSQDLSAWLLLDFGGLVVAVYSLVVQAGSTSFSLGASQFNPALVPIRLPADLWTGALIAMRTGSMAMAMLPLLPAALFFHRYSPDRVKARQSLARRTPLEFANARLRTLSALAQPLFRMAALTSGWSGQVVGDMALSLAASPVSILLVLASALASVVWPSAGLPGLLTISVLLWGVMVCDISTRDATAMTQDMTAAVIGGRAQRYASQVGAAFCLGLLMMGGIVLRWLMLAPTLALALVVGLAACAALATCLGSVSKTSRLFLGLFLFAWYVAFNARQVAWLDMVGFNGAANAMSIASYGLLALVATGLGLLNLQRQARSF